MTHSPDVLIVGAGIVGAACAYELAREGARVEVIDSQPPGGGATAAGMGHLVVLDDNPAELALSQLSVALWRELADQLPQTAEFWTCGTLWIAANEAEWEAARAKQVLYPDSTLLDAQALYEAEPQLRPGLAGGLLVPGDAVVYAPVAARWLLEQANAKVTRRTVTDITALQAGAVICATGASARTLLPDLPVRPRKGHLAITDRYPAMVRHQLVELGYLQSAHGDAAESVAFNLQPRPTGQLLIGSSRQFDSDAPGIDAPLLRRMLTRAFEFLPGLAHCQILRTWTGFRAATPDKLPLIGRLRDHLYIATGHEGLGVTTSLGTAKLITAEILGRRPPIAPEPYRPERFHA
ncbi:MAG TPA: FAD-dependent oxidoreductase [Bryobacteraceae bacterium]|nr:FAD-dependent oxidoreductase [Bryobacteraceae bacterium]